MSGIVFVLSLAVSAAVSLVTRPAGAERLETKIWRPELVKLPEEEVRGGYPVWKRAGFWFAAVVVVFIVIYAVLW